MTSTEPPLAVIAFSADLENLAAFTVNFFVNSPLPRILTPDFSAFTIPASIRIIIARTYNKDNRKNKNLTQNDDGIRGKKIGNPLEACAQDNF